MLRKIKVYGRLRKLLGWENGVYWADVNSTAEVGRFLVANWPNVKKHMVDQFYKIKASGHEIGEEDLHNPIGQEISIVPVAVGAINFKKFFSSGIGKFINYFCSNSRSLTLNSLSNYLFSIKRNWYT